MDFRPNFRFLPSTSILVLQPSATALSVAQAYRRPGSAVPGPLKRPEVVRQEAKARILRAGGDPECWQLVLSESELQFGQYQGQTFKWLLSHDVGYACGLLASHLKERDAGDTSQSPLAVHKDALVSYAKLFPGMMQVVQWRRMREGSLSVRGMDQVLVGFGVYGKMTLRALYESTSGECQSYLQWLRTRDVRGGSLLHTAQVYVLGRDKEVPEAGPSAAPPAAPPAQQATPQPASISQAGPPVPGPSSRPGPPVPGPPVPGPSMAGPSVTASDGVDEPQLPPLSTGAQLLPKGWRQTLPEEQQDWVGRALFTRGPGKQPILASELRLWWNPPGPRPLYTQPPSAHAFFQCRFFLWAPYRMWAYKLTCPSCGRQLTGAGLYRTVRRVLDLDSWYFMGTEYLECGGACKKKYAAWAQDILGQLDLAHQELFPAVLTYKLSCDKRVVGLMKERTLGNSASRLHTVLVEQHTREWMVRSLGYLSVLRKLQVPGVAPREVSVPPMPPIPNVPWLTSVYVREALSRLDETKARVTSVFGDILKMDSTKKMTKLAGDAADTAAWVTNVGNEHGQVLMSVLTDSEGDGLLPMAAGLVRRYRDAGKAPPRVLYVDRDCCAHARRCKVAAMFGDWEQLVVRLDVWHLMRRFARAVTTDSHQLYGLFISRLSFAIFEWDGGDVARLQEAKQSEEGPDAHANPTSKELARHCRRRTRGEAETGRLIQEVLDVLWDVTDSMGVRLIDHARMAEVWSTQRRHLRCIQDPPGVELYTQIGELTKGGVKLPVFRCARGSTSLESFHLHLCRFIPGTSANALHFQVYLLEGLVRWNENRARAAVKDQAGRWTMRCYNARLQRGLRQLTQQFLGKTLVENYTEPGEYTGELIGVEYLYSQTGAASLQQQQRICLDPDVPDDEDDEEDQGFEEEELPGVCLTLRETALPARPHQSPAAAEEEEDVRGPDGHGGYQHVTRLAHALVELRHNNFMTQQQLRQIVALWQKLSERDKAPISFAPRHQERLIKGRFKSRSSKTAHTPGVDSVKRSFLRQGAGAAQSPNASRLLEGVFLELCRIHYEGRTIAGVRVNRWGAVKWDYAVIRDLVCSRRDLLAAAPIQLPEVNHRTLLQWHNKRSMAMMTDTVPAAVPGPSARQAAAEPLPAARALLQEPLKPDQPLARDAQRAPGTCFVCRHFRRRLLLLLLLRCPPPPSTSAAPPPAAAASSSTAPPPRRIHLRHIHLRRRPPRRCLCRAQVHRLAEEGSGGRAAAGPGVGPARQGQKADAALPLQALWSAKDPGIRPQSLQSGALLLQGRGPLGGGLAGREDGPREGEATAGWSCPGFSAPLHLAAAAEPAAAGGEIDTDEQIRVRLLPSRCTAHRRKKREDKDRQVLSEAADCTEPQHLCAICSFPRHLDTGHACYGGQLFCSAEHADKTPQEWLQEQAAGQPIPRTTLWRMKKQQLQPEGQAEKKPQKVRTCQSCGQRSSKQFGHSQLNLKSGKLWYCALKDGISLDLWLARHRARDKEEEVVKKKKKEEEKKEKKKKEEEKKKKMEEEEQRDAANKTTTTMTRWWW